MVATKITAKRYVVSWALETGDRGARTVRTCPPPKKKNQEKYFSGNYRVKFGHFVNFSYIFFGQKCLAP